jgi:tRNA A-37 threonylcarbamoyl transferase component Bud32/tetratricopeptide (TPR) repeat protein
MPDDDANQLGRTLPGDGFSSAGMRQFLQRTPATAITNPLAEAPRLQGLTLARQLPGGDGQDDGGARFQVVSLLGSGATGEVYRVRDKNLDRFIAIKVLAKPTPEQSAQRADFIAEARLTAVLKHPNVLPVHDLDLSADGRIFFSMGQVDGRSLGQIIEASQPTQRDARLASYNAIVTAFIAIGHAISFAHHQGIIHQDIKPDNILLGDFGEVLMLDWGEAARPDGSGLVKERLAGTPLYMSPEQARREGSGPASDIYCLGGTLFHALLLRPAVAAEDLEGFWRKKRLGIIDHPTRAESAGIPPPLLAIALKALAASPDERYADIDGMVQDLESYQAGLAVRAHRYSPLERAMRWCRQHQRTLAWSGLLLAAILTLSAMLFGERLKEIAAWGAPVLSEGFSDDSWSTRWAVNHGSFERRGNALVSTAADASVLMCRTRFVGSTAIEFTGEALAESPLCDLSVFWCRDIAFDEQGRQAVKLTDLYKLQIGAYDNSYSAILLPNDRQLANNPFRIEHGRRYRVRAEIVDNVLRLLVDGRLICEYTDPFPFSSGYVGIYGYYRGKAFSDIRIYSLGLPQKLQASAIGDAFAQKQLFDLAAEQYQRAAAAFPGGPAGQAALYKAGLCLYRAGRFDSAFATWLPLAGSPYADLVALQKLDRAFALGDHDLVIAGLAAIAHHAAADSALQVALRWAAYVYEIRDYPGHEQRLQLLGRYLKVHDEHFAGQVVADRATMECLLHLGRPQDILERFPANRFFCAVALTYQQRFMDIVRDYPDQHALWCRACLRSGSFGDLSTRTVDADQRAIADILHGRASEVTAHRDLDVNTRAMALLALGLYQQVLELPGVDREWSDLAWIGLGKAERAADPALRCMAQDQPRQLLDLLPSDDQIRAWPRFLIGLEATIAGDGAAAFGDAIIPVENWYQPSGELSFAHGFIKPFIAELHGRPGDVDRSCAEIIAHHRYEDCQRPWYAARLISGQISGQEFLAQPQQLSAPAWLLAASGIAAERAGSPAAALTAYREFLALGPRRHGLAIAPIMDAFVSWRVRELAGAPRDRLPLPRAGEPGKR